MQLNFKLIKEGDNITNKEQFIKDFQEYVKKLPDGIFVCNIKKWFKKRSLNQNDFYWGVIIPKLSEYFCITPSEVHDEIKYKFLRVTWVGIGWEEISKTMSTTTLNTKEWEEYIDRIRKWIIEEYNITLPLPHEY